MWREEGGEGEGGRNHDKAAKNISNGLKFLAHKEVSSAIHGGSWCGCMNLGRATLAMLDALSCLAMSLLQASINKKTQTNAESDESAKIHPCLCNKKCLRRAVKLLQTMEAKRKDEDKTLCSCNLASCVWTNIAERGAWETFTCVQQQRTWRRSGHVDVRTAIKAGAKIFGDEAW